MYDDELYHYGVLGMKWGVRRSPEQLGRRPQHKDVVSKVKNKKRVSNEELNSRIDKLRNWESLVEEGINPKEYARQICKDIIATRTPEDCHSFLKRISTTLDADVYDNPSIMAVNKKTGYMRYNSCVLFDQHNIYPDSKNGLYNTKELDDALGHERGSTYYYCWGELQNND